MWFFHLDTSFKNKYWIFCLTQNRTEQRINKKTSFEKHSSWSSSKKEFLLIFSWYSTTFKKLMMHSSNLKQDMNKGITFYMF